jgi:hypothetical protein
VPNVPIANPSEVLVVPKLITVTRLHCELSLPLIKLIPIFPTVSIIISCMIFAMHPSLSTIPVSEQLVIRRLLSSTTFVALISCTPFAVGYEIGAENVAINNCIALDIEAESASIGFDLDGNAITCDNCLTESISSALPVSGGFIVPEVIDISLTNCQASNVNGAGFVITGTASLLNCVSSFNNTDGFTITSLGVNSLIGNCVAFENGGVGFNAVLAGTPMYGCFASKNGTNYSVNSPNVQNASTGILSAGNTFIP